LLPIKIAANSVGDRLRIDTDIELKTIAKPIEFIAYFCQITIPIGVVIWQKWWIITPLSGAIPQICGKVSSVGMLSSRVPYNI
jgi:hypothetical protein